MVTIGELLSNICSQQTKENLIVGESFFPCIHIL